MQGREPKKQKERERRPRTPWDNSLPKRKALSTGQIAYSKLRHRLPTIPRGRRRLKPVEDPAAPMLFIGARRPERP